MIAQDASMSSQQSGSNLAADSETGSVALPKRASSPGDLDLSRPTKRLNLEASPKSPARHQSFEVDREMSDEGDAAPRLSAAAKGKGKMKHMREMPEVVWTKIFEHYYDGLYESECTPQAPHTVYLMRQDGCLTRRTEMR
jgi:hypothetical protein